MRMCFRLLSPTLGYRAVITGLTQETLRELRRPGDTSFALPRIGSQATQLTGP
jgi:hypothetical protein